MVAIPKIVLKAQTRISLNERFTAYNDQHQSRQQMAREDMETRLAEERMRGRHDPSMAETAEIARKLADLQKVIETQMYPRSGPAPHEPRRRMNRANVSPSISSSVSPPVRRRYSPDRQPTYRHGPAMEDPIVPEYRSLLYSQRSPLQRQPYDPHNNGYNSRNRPRKDLTYGDLINGGGAQSSYTPLSRRPPSPPTYYPSPVSSAPTRRMYSDLPTSHQGYYDRPSTSSNVLRSSNNRYHNPPKANGIHSRVGPPVRPVSSPPPAVSKPQRSRYRHPLMRDSGSEEEDNGIELKQSFTPSSFRRPQPTTVAQTRPSLGLQRRTNFKPVVRKPVSNVKNRLGFFKKSALQKRTAGIVNTAKKFRGRGTRKFGAVTTGAAVRPAGKRLTVRKPVARGGAKGAATRGRGKFQAKVRSQLSKEDLDRQLDEYNNRKGLGEEKMAVDV